MAESANKPLLSALTEGHEKALRSSARTSNYRSSETTKQTSSSTTKKNNSTKQKPVGSGSANCK